MGKVINLHKSPEPKQALNVDKLQNDVSIFMGQVVEVAKLLETLPRDNMLFWVNEVTARPYIAILDRLARAANSLSDDVKGMAEKKGLLK
jgi:hypothetical protein